MVASSMMTPSAASMAHLPWISSHLQDGGQQLLDSSEVMHELSTLQQTDVLAETVEPEGVLVRLKRLGRRGVWHASERASHLACSNCTVLGLSKSCPSKQEFSDE